MTCHDGFTLRDLVSYDAKHNDANGEDNRDGSSDNRSWNCGAEGPTDDPQIRSLRSRQQRNLLVTLLLSQGVPMLAAGDELGKTQDGNNNAYCQDSELSWIDWKSIDVPLLEFTRTLIEFRRKHPLFRRRRFFQGQAIHGSRAPDIAWFTPDAEEMGEEHWGEGFAKSLAVFLNGAAIQTPDARGEKIRDDSFYLLFNAHDGALEFTLPDGKWAERWEPLLDTAARDPWAKAEPVAGGSKVTVDARSIRVMRRA